MSSGQGPKFTQLDPEAGTDSAGAKSNWWSFKPPLDEKTGLALNPRAAVPVLLFLFVFSLIMDNGFKLLTTPIQESLELSNTTASLQASIPGILIGIGAVVYAALADSIAIRRLMIFAVIVMSAGSLLGYFLQDTFGGVMAGRILQTAGLAAAETLYVIWATKHFSGDQQKKYLGFSAAAFQASMLIGAVGSGFIDDYIGWQAFFLINLIALGAIPFIIKYVPAERTTSSHLDIFGLLAVAVFATTLVLFMENFQYWYLLPAGLALIAFIWHVKVHDNVLVTKEFFGRIRYPSMLLVVFILYSVQLAYQVQFPALLLEVYDWSQADASLLLVPGYAAAVLVGILTGRIAKFLPSKPAIILATIMIAAALFLGSFGIGLWVGLYAFSMVLFGSGFALLYAPLLSTAVRDIPAAKSGVAIGFYNLVINMAVPIGIAYGAKLVEVDLDLTGFVGQDRTGASFGSMLLILAFIAILALVVYVVFSSSLDRQDRREGIPVPSSWRFGFYHSHHRHGDHKPALDLMPDGEPADDGFGDVATIVEGDESGYDPETEPPTDK